MVLVIQIFVLNAPVGFTPPVLRNCFGLVKPFWTVFILYMFFVIAVAGVSLMAILERLMPSHLYSLYSSLLLLLLDASFCTIGWQLKRVGVVRFFLGPDVRPALIHCDFSDHMLGCGLVVIGRVLVASTFILSGVFLLLHK
ncbi:hypothetical protein IFM89_036255 [Coptis chinensis]|uniref:Uncharacterized protein n=1 Tax=Coptis chinensis TaxID=261450 RepID=A0A835HET6_9MAGN|nr:hypothetical protein IFM89_036255 [Coptis chinensis]